MKKITVFGKPGCGQCKLAIDLCKKYQIMYEYINVASGNNLDILMEKANSLSKNPNGVVIKQIPQIFIFEHKKEKRIGGLNALKKELGIEN